MLLLLTEDMTFKFFLALGTQEIKCLSLEIWTGRSDDHPSPSPAAKERKQ